MFLEIYFLLKKLIRNNPISLKRQQIYEKKPY